MEAKRRSMLLHTGEGEQVWFNTRTQNNPDRRGISAYAKWLRTWDGARNSHSWAPFLGISMKRRLKCKAKKEIFAPCLTNCMASILSSHSGAPLGNWAGLRGFPCAVKNQTAAHFLTWSLSIGKFSMRDLVTIFHHILLCCLTEYMTLEVHVHWKAQKACHCWRRSNLLYVGCGKSSH